MERILFTETTERISLSEAEMQISSTAERAMIKFGGMAPAALKTKSSTARITLSAVPGTIPSPAGEMPISCWVETATTQFGEIKVLQIRTASTTGMISWMAAQVMIPLWAAAAVILSQEIQVMMLFGGMDHWIICPVSNMETTCLRGVPVKIRL